ncbi:hypothetical protein WP50_30310 [Lactiplantibacillus plantarum]|nr:hypothetical protein WP50_30310 [Lactiplantibacillus plantarum]
MANRIPEEKVEQVRSAVNIADFIGQYVQLEKAGKNVFGLFLNKHGLWIIKRSYSKRAVASFLVC